jgi:hypothetical protein
MSDTTTPAVFSAVGKAQKHFATYGVGKGGTNKEQGYRFRGIDDLLNAASAALTHAGLMYVPCVEERTVSHGQTAKGTAFVDVALRVRYDIFSTEDGSQMPSSAVIYGEGRDYADKATNKALSAALKYFLTQLFCIPFLGVLEEGDETTIEGQRTIDMTQIEQAKDMMELKYAYETAMQLAKSAKDVDMQKRIAAAKDKRKSVLAEVVA